MRFRLHGVALGNPKAPSCATSFFPKVLVGIALTDELLRLVMLDFHVSPRDDFVRSLPAMTGYCSVCVHIIFI